MSSGFDEGAAEGEPVRHRGAMSRMGEGLV